MLNAPHTPALSFAPADHPGERRQRHTMPGSSAILPLPVGIHSDGPQPYGPAAGSQTVSTSATTAAPALMGRVIHMSAVGVWAVILNGRLAELDGVMHWPDQDSLAAAAARAGITLSDLVTRTGRAA